MAHIDLIQPVGSRHDAPNRCSAEPLTVSSEPSGAVVVALSGEVDMTNCAALRDRITEPLRSTHHLVLDLSEVTFLCAAGLTVLVDASAAAIDRHEVAVPRSRAGGGFPGRWPGRRSC